MSSGSVIISTVHMHKQIDQYCSKYVFDYVHLAKTYAYPL